MYILGSLLLLSVLSVSGALLIAFAGADLLPEVRAGEATTPTQLGALLIGIGAMYGITLVV